MIFLQRYSFKIVAPRGCVLLLLRFCGLPGVPVCQWDVICFSVPDAPTEKCHPREELCPGKGWGSAGPASVYHGAFCMLKDLQGRDPFYASDVGRARPG